MTTMAAAARTGSRPLRDALYGDLVWSRPGMFRRELLLESGSEVLASLRWEKLLSFEATAESADGRWLIGHHRSGSLLGQVRVREAATGAEVASFTRKWMRKGTARFTSGAEYLWERTGFWQMEFFWSSPQQPRLVTYARGLGFTIRFEMRVDPAALRVRELPVLVLLGAYLFSTRSARRASN